MARILILQEEAGPLQALRKSLESHHELVFVKRIDDAIKTLLSTKIDLIISRVHLEKASSFEFIELVKQNPQLAETPFILFCGKKTKLARLLDDVLARAGEQLGADKYLSLNQEDCDFDRLRQEIEGCLTKTS